MHAADARLQAVSRASARFLDAIRENAHWRGRQAPGGLVPPEPLFIGYKTEIEIYRSPERSGNGRSFSGLLSPRAPIQVDSVQ
jgi:hypothetical protein